MFENEIKFISDFSLNKIRNLGSFVTYEKLSGSKLHPAIVTYISAELDYMIYRDRKKLLQDSIFDYTGREISDHLNVIASEIKRSKKISIDDIEKLILQAVSFNVNYVVRPKWSITKLIYNNEDFVSVDELNRMLNYLYYYDYIKSVLSAYISRRKVIQLTITEFDLILNKIDRELFKANTEELINNALFSISDIFNIGGLEKTRVSLAAVEIFLREKNLMDHLLKLRHSVPNTTKNKYEISDITQIIYSDKTIYPGAVTGSPEKNSFADHDEKSKPEAFEEKIETIEFHDSEIVTEEKIKSKTSSEEPQIEDIIVEETRDQTTPESEIIEDDMLPIEEEFRSEILNGEADSEPVETNLQMDEENKLSETEPQPEFTFEDEPKENQTEKSETETEEEIVIEDEISGDEETVSDKDDLLTSYEQELAAKEEKEDIEDASSEDRAELKEGSITEDTQDPTEDIPAEKNNIATGVDKEKDDNIDLSIFDDEETEKDFDEILSQVSADFQDESSQIDEKDEPVKEDKDSSGIETDKESDSDSSEEPEINNMDLSAGKEIIDEMLDDYFGESKSTDEDQDSGTTESSSEVLDEQTGEKLPVKDISTETSDDNSVDDISDIIDDIDDIILNSSTDEIVEDITDQDQQDELPLDEEFKIDDEAKVDESVKTDDESHIADEIISEEKPAIEEQAATDKQEEKAEDHTGDEKDKAREKDLFSYLSRKEVKKIVSNVFASDYEDFVTTIEKISECVAYKQATEILKGVFFTYRVSPYSKDAVMLTNAVSHYFRQI
ncbi:MAG: hypothetical protein PVF17_02855 [Ignavibacteria bacterium]|jgi:hypothetical protein